MVNIRAKEIEENFCRLAEKMGVNFQEAHNLLFGRTGDGFSGYVMKTETGFSYTWNLLDFREEIGEVHSFMTEEGVLYFLCNEMAKKIARGSGETEEEKKISKYAKEIEMLALVSEDWAERKRGKRIDLPLPESTFTQGSYKTGFIKIDKKRENLE